MADAEQAVIPKIESPAAERPRPRPSRKLSEIIPSQLESLRQYHRAVLETQAVEAVHKMRVTTRRLQASLDLLEREMKLRKQKRRLRTWRRKLSTVRNYDVFLELIEKESPSRGRTRREQLHLIKTILQERRDERATQVRHFLESIDIDRLAGHLGLSTASKEQAAGTVAEDDKQPDGSASHKKVQKGMIIDESALADYAAERLDQRLAEFLALVAQSHPTNDPAELHQLRIAAKRVRYLLEIVSEIGYGDASRPLVWLRTLQDRIGDWHDMEALEEEIIIIVSNPEFMKQHLSESGQMLQAAAHLQKKKRALMAKLFPVKVPRHLILTSERLARALRRRANAR